MFPFFLVAQFFHPFQDDHFDRVDLVVLPDPVGLVLLADLGDLSESRPHYKEPATPIIRQCNGIFTDQSIFRYFFSCETMETGQFQSA